jgi:hypothetical protein
LIIVTFGQLDGLVGLGAVLGFVALRKAQGRLLGLAILLLCLKPQVGGVLALVYLIQMYQTKSWQPVLVALGVVSGVVIFSFVVFGFWLNDWLRKIFQAGASDGIEFVNVSSDIGLYPYGLAILIIVLWLARRNIPALIAATLLAAPYAGYYSIVAALVFPLPLFIYVATWIPALFPTLGGC